MTPAQQKRCALYSRCSTSTQDPSLQQTELRQVAEQRGWHVVIERTDIGSGKRASRPGIDEIRELARRGKLDLIVVWRLDRLGRSLKNFLDVLQELRDAKVNLVSLREGFDLETSMGRAMAQLLALLAELEGEWNKERVLAGLAEARRKGRRLGRRPRAVDVDQALELRASGKSIREVARALDVPRAVLHRAVTSPAGGRCSVCDVEVLTDMHERSRWHLGPDGQPCDGAGRGVVPLRVSESPPQVADGGA